MQERKPGSKRHRSAEVVRRCFILTRTVSDGSTVDSSLVQLKLPDPQHSTSLTDVTRGLVWSDTCAVTIPLQQARARISTQARIGRRERVCIFDSQTRDSHSVLNFFTFLLYQVDLDPVELTSMTRVSSLECEYKYSYRKMKPITPCVYF